MRADPTRDALRLPVQWTIRPRGGRDDERTYAGQLAGGTLAVGDAVKVLPAGRADDDRGDRDLRRPLEDAVPPLSVAVRLADDLDVGRGDLICSPEHAPVAARELDATVAWMGEAELRAGRALRAQAHDAHGARDRPGRARPARHDDARGPARARRGSSSTTSAA